MSIDSVSLIVPAFNEESYLGATLDSLKSSIEHLNVEKKLTIEIVVVDNASTDSTSQVAHSKGARVIHEPRGNVAVARNAGAKAAQGELLIFIDADTHWPPEVLASILESMKSGHCIGGAVDTEYSPKKFTIQLYLRFWRLLGKIFGMAQGATQFCLSDAFSTLEGYDSSLYMGEDVDFHARLKKHARQHGGTTSTINDVRVIPSCRKFGQWPIWKTILLTNPLTCLLFCKLKKPLGRLVRKTHSMNTVLA